MKRIHIILFFLGLFLAGNACSNPNTDAPTSTVSGDVQGNPSYKNLNVTEFKTMMSESADAVVIDVRTPGEIVQGKIEGALEMDFYQDDFQKNILSLDKDKSYFMYCRSGNRSGKAAKFMIDNGFTRVYNLSGGFNAWENQ